MKATAIPSVQGLHGREDSCSSVLDWEHTIQSTLKMEAAVVFKMFVPTYRTIQYHSPEDNDNKQVYIRGKG
jgi:hypothetical protein